MKLSKNAKTIFKITVSLVLITVIFFTVDRQSLIENFKLLDIRYAPLILILFLANYIFSSVRWKFLLVHDDTEDVSIPYLTSLYFVGSFFNNFMPTSIGGDVYKIFKLGQKIKNNANAFSATFMERFTGMMALVVISYIGLIQTLSFWIGLLPENIQSNDLLILLVKIAIFAGFWIAAVVGFYSMKFVAKKISLVDKVYQSLMAYKGNFKVVWNAFLTSFLVQLIAIFTQFFVFKAMGVDLPIMYALFVFPVIFLVSFFIPSINGFGVQDFLYIQFFANMGVSTELALSTSIIYHLFRLVVSLIGGVLYAIGKDD